MPDRRTPLLTPTRASERTSAVARLQARVRTLQARVRARGDGATRPDRRGRRPA